MARPKKETKPVEVVADVIGSTVEDRKDANSDIQGASVVTHVSRTVIFEIFPGNGGPKKILAGLPCVRKAVYYRGNAIYQTIQKRLGY